MPETLNLSNEVVKMRAEVKRVKVLIIRKLTRQIAALKKKKGKEADLERNQRRAARLLEEIQELKGLAPDSITKAALQKDISFEKVCQNKEANLSERAIARIATHPEFSRRIQDIKKAIAVFKAERTSGAKAEKKARKEFRDIIQEQSESEQDSDGEEEAEESLDGEKDGKELEGDDGPSQTVHKANTEELSEMEKQDEETSATAKEKSSGSAPAEVARMRKEVRKLRMLIIRKLTQQIASLRKTKGEDSELKENQACIARLQKEVQVLRGLLPDHVTTRALQGNINVEEVFQNPESSPIERAMARIATHARFIKKLQDVREALEKERTKAAQPEEKKNMTTAEDSDDEGEDSDDEEEHEDESEEGASDGEEEDHEDEEEDGASDSDDEDDDNTEENEKGKDKAKPLNMTKGSNVAKPSMGIKPPSVLSSKQTAKSKVGVTEQVATPSANLKSISKTPLTADTVPALPVKSKETPVRKAPPSRQDIKPETKKPEIEGSEEESDLESSDGEEEKEYFDDSTEERFHKQSSLSEDSEEDDFFIGKVSKLKKKKSDAPVKKKSEPEAGVEGQNVKEASEFKMQSVFCSTLSKSSGTSQKGKPHGPKPPRFQNQKKQPDGDARPSWFRSPGTDRRPPAAGPKGPGPKQMGISGTRPGKPAFERKHTQSNKGAPGKPFRPPQHSQQALHPSWEASRKRKEQQSQITAFQGKKIKFDDDD